MPVTTSETYGSKTYESLVLSQTPTAVFGPYNSSNGIVDMTNNNYLSASISSTASYSDKIPFFALAGANYSFEIKASSKIIIKELVSGAGYFSIGDELRNFSVEFLMCKNFDNDGNPSFARFGISGTQPNVTVSYDRETNYFYLDMYNQSGSHVYRSSAYGGLIESSNHFVINMLNGRPEMYLNAVRADELLNKISNSSFFSKRSVGRVVAEFGCSDDTQPIEISMISFYPYALNETMIKNRYSALYDYQDMKSIAIKTGGAILHQNIQPSQSINRNDDKSQDFFGTNVINTYTDPDIRISTFPNFKPYFSIYNLNNEILLSGSSVRQELGFSFLSEDYRSAIKDDSISINFMGVGSGAFNLETPLIFFENTSVGDIHVSIDSASSKIFIGSSSTTKLAYMSSSISRGASYSVNISFSGSSIYVNMQDGSASTSYNFGSDISTENSNVYLFNRYYRDENEKLISVGNSLLNFYETYLSDPYSAYIKMTSPFPLESGSLAWNYYQYKVGEFLIDIPTPDSQYNYLKILDTSNIFYTLYIDSSSYNLTQSSVVYIPTTSSNVYLLGQISAYWNGMYKNTVKNSMLREISMSNYSSASYLSIGYPSLVESSSGVINSEPYPTIFRREKNGFFQPPNNILSLYSTDIDLLGIGQIDFMICVPDILSSSNQTLMKYSNTASMGLTYNSTSNVYLINFFGMTASLNSQSIVSGSTKIYPRSLCFLQLELSSSVVTGSPVYLFSNQDGSNPLRHWFDRVSVFEPNAEYKKTRYAQIYGRRNVRISDNDNEYLKIQSVPDDIDIINQTWQVYYS